MLFERSTFIGIDPTAGGKPFTYAAVDDGMRLLALGQGQIDDIVAFAAGQRQALAAICAPRRPNLGVMAQPEIRQALSPPPHPGRWERFRLADYLLRQRGIAIPRTPANESHAANWMRLGFAVYRRLESVGYQEYPTTGAERMSLEVYPHACYAALLGHLPYPKHSLEGRLQRQLALYEQEMHVADPLEFLEEITRHRLLTGRISYDRLHTPEELDALAAALTAWLAAHHPERVERLGDPDEGEVVIPLAKPESSPFSL